MSTRVETYREGAMAAGRVGLSLGLAGGAVAATIDAVGSFLSGFHGNPIALLAYELSLVCTELAVAGCLYALWLHVCLERPATPKHPTLRLAMAAAPWAAYLCWVPSAWTRLHWARLELLQRGTCVFVYLGLVLGDELVTGKIELHLRQ